MKFHITGFTEYGEWLDESLEADSIKEAYQAMDLRLSFNGDMTGPDTEIVPEKQWRSND